MNLKFGRKKSKIWLEVSHEKEGKKLTKRSVINWSIFSPLTFSSILYIPIHTHCTHSSLSVWNFSISLLPVLWTTPLLLQTYCLLSLSFHYLINYCLPILPPFALYFLPRLLCIKIRFFPLSIPSLFIQAKRSEIDFRVKRIISSSCSLLSVSEVME